MASLLLTNDSVRVVQPKVSKEFGERQAKLLQQVHFWIQNQNNKGTIHNGKKWVYNTYEDWAEQIGVSVASIGRYFYYLKKRGVILSDFLNHRRSERTKYYTINYDRLNEIFGETSEEFHPKKDAKTLILSGSSTQNERIYIQREHTKINNNSSEGEPSKKLVNFCDNFKNPSGNVLQEGIIDQKPLSIPETIKKYPPENISENIQEKVIQTTNSKNFQQEISLEIQQQLQDIQSNSSQKSSKINKQSFSQEPLKSKENQPSHPLSKDKNTLEKASVVLTQLLEIYNQEVGYYVGNVTLNKDRARFLMAGYIKKFDKNLDKWRLFCKSIVSSDHLLGKINKTFKLSFDWVLKFTTIDKFLKGDYGIRKTLSQLEAEKDAQKEKEQAQNEPLKDLKTHENFPELRAQILKDLGAQVYQETFKNCTFDQEERFCPFTGELDSFFVIEAPTKEIEAQIQWRYNSYLDQDFIKGNAQKIKFDKILSKFEKDTRNQENLKTFETFSSWKNTMTLEEQNDLLKVNGYRFEADDLFGLACLFNVFKETFKKEKRAA
ncbi:MAG TPA: hypothetical protein VI959_05140 [Alphaproteobacteria bacterium]|nr:hypothetical protein [Alphaproteobacteria bacterium]